MNKYKIAFHIDQIISNRAFFMGLYNAVKDVHQCVFWESQVKNPFDFFNEFHPDIIFINRHNVSRAFCRAAKKYPPKHIVYLTEMEKTEKELKKLLGNDQLDISLPEGLLLTRFNDPERTEKADVILPASDTVNYLKKPRKDKDIDLVYCGRSSEELQKIIFPLLYDQTKKRIQLFGYELYGTNQHLGIIDDTTLADKYNRSKVSLNISRGNKVNQRVFNILSSGGICVTTPSDLTKSLFDDNIYYIKDDQPIDLSVNRKQTNGYNFVLGEHTYYHRWVDIFERLEMKEESDSMVKIANELYKKEKL